jgi:hypothetical protein
VLKRLAFFLLMLVALPALAGGEKRMKEAWLALEEYDFFKARKLSYRSLEQQPALASTVLAAVYLRNNNPFYHPDSAYRYARMARIAWGNTSSSSIKNWLKWGMDTAFHKRLNLGVDSLFFELAKKQNSLEAISQYLLKFPASIQLPLAVEWRNELAFQEAILAGNSTAFSRFLETYPLAMQAALARAKREEAWFREASAQPGAKAWKDFLNAHPGSPFAQQAEDSLFGRSTSTQSLFEFVNFVRSHPSNRNENKAWQKIYELEARENTPNFFVRFKSKYPDYPFAQQVERETTLSNRLFLEARRDGKWGFVDDNGLWQVKPMFEWVDGFSEDLSAVGKDGKAGYISKTGIERIGFLFDEAEAFHEGRAVVRINNEWGIIDRAGAWILKPTYSEINDFAEGMATYKDKGKMGYLNRNGQVAIPAQFDQASDFKDGIAVAEINGKSGLLLPSGSWRLEPRYEWIDDFSHGLARCQVGEFQGLIRANGSELLPAEFDQIEGPFDTIFVIIRESKLGLFSTGGSWVLPLQLEWDANRNQELSISNGLLPMWGKGKMGLMNLQGKWVLAPEFAGVKNATDGLCPVRKKLKWGVVDLNQKMIVKYQFDNMTSFQYGLARVKNKRSGWGCISIQGSLVVPLEWDEINLFPPFGYAPVKQGKKGLMNAEGRILLAPEWDELQLQTNGFIKGMKSGKMHWLAPPNWNVVFAEP